MTVTKFYRLSQRAQASRWHLAHVIGLNMYFENGEGEQICVAKGDVGRMLDEVEMVTEFEPEELEEERGRLNFVRKFAEEGLENGTYL